VRFLVENGINLAVRNGGGHMPLHFASACQNSKIPKLLLENGADPTAITWRNRTTPLDIAKRHGSTEVVKLLEEACRLKSKGSKDYILTN
jgi:ankyrin repeat protein